jgi:hypothetical protein
MRSSRLWMRSSRVWMRSSQVCMRSNRVVRASACQCRSSNSPGLDPSILRHSGILGAADEGVLNNVTKSSYILYCKRLLVTYSRHEPLNLPLFLNCIFYLPSRLNAFFTNKKSIMNLYFDNKALKCGLFLIKNIFVL